MVKSTFDYSEIEWWNSLSSTKLKEAWKEKLDELAPLVGELIRGKDASGVETVRARHLNNDIGNIEMVLRKRHVEGFW